MLTTLRQEQDGVWRLEITVRKDGHVDQTIGPFRDKDLALRWERYSLIRHHTWENILSWDVRDNFARQNMREMAVRKIVTQTDEAVQIPFPAGHQNWMERHPLEESANV